MSQSPAAFDTQTQSKRVHDLRNARDGLKTLFGLMQKGFPFHTDQRGAVLLQSMEKYIAIVSKEVEVLEQKGL